MEPALLHLTETRPCIFDQRFDQGQAQSRPFVFSGGARLELAKDLKELTLILRGNAGARICHKERCIG